MSKSFEPSQIGSYIEKVRAGESMSAFARRLGITRQGLIALIKGHYRASSEILKLLKIEETYRVVATGKYIHPELLAKYCEKLQAGRTDIEFCAAYSLTRPTVVQLKNPDKASRTKVSTLAKVGLALMYRRTE